MPYYTPDQLLPDARGLEPQYPATDLDTVIGQVWAEKYGNDFLEVLCEAVTEDGHENKYGPPDGMPGADDIKARNLRRRAWTDKLREAILNGRDAEAGAMVRESCERYVQDIAESRW